MREKKLLDIIRANVAGAEAVAVRTAAETLFATGGRRLLAEVNRRTAAELRFHLGGRHRLRVQHPRRSGDRARSSGRR